MKILIIEAYTNANIGSCALVENTIKLLQKQLNIPLEHIRVMAHYPSIFEEKYGVKSVQDIFQYPYKKNRLSQVFWLAKTICWMFFAWCFPQIAIKSKKWEDFAWADKVISVGAERINDKYIKSELFSLFTYAIVKKFGKKMILAPSTYGPFIHSFTKKSASYVFKSLDLIYCRDQKSYDTVIQFRGLDNSKLINSFDVAIFQDWSTDIKSSLFEPNRQTVGISVLRWIYIANKYETPYCNYQSYKVEMARLIDTIIGKYDLNIILFPTNFPINGCREDDIAVAKEIYELCTYKEQIKIMDKLPSPTEFKSFLSACEVNITTRMHACILSTSAYIPTMSINYLFKLKEYMQEIGLADYSIDIEDFNSDDAMTIFDRLWKNKIQLRKELEISINQKKSKLKADIRKIATI